MAEESARTVAVAMATNLGVALAKSAAAVVTRSTAMSAEAAHAFADTGNQMLLLVAQRRSRRPPDERHPFGHGREAYFWALIASVGVFVAGAVFSVREGVTELLHPSAAQSFGIAYAVLIVAAVLDLVSLSRAVHQVRAEARQFRRGFLDQVLLTSDPTSRAVFAEDIAAFVGPRKLWVLARLDIEDSLRGDEVEAHSRSIESGLVRAQSPYVVRVDVVPIGSGD